MLFVLIVGRWMSPKGDISRDQLSQLLLVYIGMAADILEYVTEGLKSPSVMCNSELVMLVLVMWSWSLFQFTLSLTATINTDPNKKKGNSSRRKIRTSRKSSSSSSVVEEEINPSKGCRCLCLETEIWSILVTTFMQDAPFLATRLYFMVVHNSIDQSSIFFTCKNALLLLIQTYRVVIIISNECKQRKKAKEMAATQVFWHGIPNGAVKLKRFVRDHNIKERMLGKMPTGHTISTDVTYEGDTQASNHQTLELPWINAEQTRTEPVLATTSSDIEGGPSESKVPSGDCSERSVRNGRVGYIFRAYVSIREISQRGNSIRRRWLKSRVTRSVGGETVSSNISGPMYVSQDGGVHLERPSNETDGKEEDHIVPLRQDGVDAKAIVESKPSHLRRLGRIMISFKSVVETAIGGFTTSDNNDALSSTGHYDVGDISSDNKETEGGGGKEMYDHDLSKIKVDSDVHDRAEEINGSHGCNEGHSSITLDDGVDIDDYTNEESRGAASYENAGYIPADTTEKLTGEEPTTVMTTSDRNNDQASTVISMIANDLTMLTSTTGNQ